MTPAISILAVVATSIAVLSGWMYVERRRAVAALSVMACPGCGIEYGKAVAAAAPTNRAKEISQLLKSYPDRRFRLASDWPVLCAACGLASRFDYNKHTISEDLAH